jgi:hypothetical protein
MANEEKQISSHQPMVLLDAHAYTEPLHFLKAVESKPWFLVVALT